jgi:ABC-type amino acid transport substrate-binding protein
LYDRVVSSGKLRCGYTIDPPGCLKNPNTGQLSGIGIETIELLGKHLGLQVEWTEEVDWGTMIEGLETGRYDIVATPIWPNAERARVVDFSKPLYFSPIWAYGKAGDKRIIGGGLSDLNSSDHSIASIDGATPQVIAREDFPKARIVSLPQQSQISHMLLSVSTGKADVTFVEPAVAAAFLKNNPGTIQRIPTERPLRIFPNCWAFKRGQTEFKAMLDTVLDQLINSGNVDKLVARYEPAPNTLFRAALPYQSASNH